MEGRDYVTGNDVQAVFRDVCTHRVLLKEDTNQTVEDVLNDLLKSVENPDRHSRGTLKQ
jgi:MoxR-like ATPase